MAKRPSVSQTMGVREAQKAGACQLQASGTMLRPMVLCCESQAGGVGVGGSRKKERRALQYAASFDCPVGKWYDCEETKPKPVCGHEPIPSHEMR